MCASYGKQLLLGLRFGPDVDERNRVRNTLCTILDYYALERLQAQSDCALVVDAVSTVHSDLILCAAR